MDSPRGRIYLMRMLTEGTIAPTPETLNHFDLCLGCLACETACPANVQYHSLIEETREQVRALKQPSYFERLQQHVIDQVFPHPWALEAMLLPLRAARALGIRPPKYEPDKDGLLRKLMGPMELMPELPPIAKEPLPPVTPARGKRRFRVGMLSGCVMNVIFRETNRATIRVLARAGCEVVTPPEQVCCGALLVHGGNGLEARKLAKRNIELFNRLELDAIIVNAAGCGATLRTYDQLMEDEPHWHDRASAFSRKVRDVSEWLHEIGYDPGADADPAKVQQFADRRKPKLTYHDACHLAHGQRVREQPRSLLQKLPGFDWVELTEADTCCGSAGTYNLTQPEMANALLERKVEHLVASGADLITTGNPGCLMQVQMGLKRRGLEVPVLHPVDLLDAVARE